MIHLHDPDDDVAPEAIAAMRERLNERYGIGTGRLRVLEEPDRYTAALRRYRSDMLVERIALALAISIAIILAWTM